MKIKQFPVKDVNITVLQELNGNTLKKMTVLLDYFSKSDSYCIHQSFSAGGQQTHGNPRAVPKWSTTWVDSKILFYIFMM
jgi:hypothetical protein